MLHESGAFVGFTEEGYGAVRLRARGDQHLMPASYIEFVPSSADRTIAVTSWIRSLAVGPLSSLLGSKALNVFGSGQMLTNCRRKKPRKAAFRELRSNAYSVCLNLTPSRSPWM